MCVVFGDGALSCSTIFLIYCQVWFEPIRNNKKRKENGINWKERIGLLIERLQLWQLHHQLYKDKNMNTPGKKRNDWNCGTIEVVMVVDFIIVTFRNRFETIIKFVSLVNCYFFLVALNCTTFFLFLLSLLHRRGRSNETNTHVHIYIYTQNDLWTT